MAKATNTKKPKYAPPSRVVHQAGIEMPKSLLLFLQVYNGFVGKMTEEFRAILQSEEDSIAKDVLELILMLESKMGYYPVSVLLGMADREDEVPKSYFARMDGIRAKTFAGKSIASYTTQLESLVESLEEDFREEIVLLKNFLTDNIDGWTVFNALAPFFDEEKKEPLVRKLLNYYKVGREKLVVFPECLNAWSGIDSSFLELVIVGSLQVLSSNRELMELWEREDEGRRAELAEFEASDDGKALLEYCKRFEKGAWHYLTFLQLVQSVNWRGKSKGETILAYDQKGKILTKRLGIDNPEIAEFLRAKKTWCDLNRQKDPPTWRPVTWDQNPHFPFFDGKFVGCMIPKAGKGGKVRMFFAPLRMVPFGGHYVTCLKLPSISDNLIEGLKSGEFPLSLGRSQLTSVFFSPENRLKISPEVRFINGSFLRHDTVSSRVIIEAFKGIRFARDKKSEYWKAWLTTEPTFEYKALFDEASSAYWSGQRPSLPPGTIVSSFVVSISPTHHPDGEIGYMTFWGIGDDGESIFLGATKVSPYQVFHGQDANRMVWDPKMNDGVGDFSKGHAKGASNCIEVNDIVRLKKRINSNRRNMGFPKFKLKKGENKKLWEQLRWAADTLRKQTAANVMAIQAVIEGVPAFRKGGQLKFNRPKGVIEFRKRYPEGCYALLLPAPMGASHQRHKGKDQNRILQTVGVAGIYEGVIARAYFSGFNTIQGSKSELFTRCAKPPKKIGTGPFEVIGTGDYCDGRFADVGEAEFACPTCKGSWGCGFVGSSNLMREFMNPAPKERKAKKKKKEKV